ncbi:heparinase II/III family protein [Vibrio rumoiensis]|uniref:Heparinase II/III family protein n=1 Tax=Vibrio rumoiensis TaxID=76258 RepID=A0ABW7IYA3_9VIBR
MLQFNSEQIQNIRQRSTQPFINNLIDENTVVLHSETLVPPDSRATWNLYYFCPEHGVRLIWDRNKPTEHCCPVDHKVFTGEPYDGAWWRGLNGLNSKACNQLGLLWQITGDKKYLTKVTDILLQYAKYYPDYQEHGGIPYNGPGKANAQTLCEANCNLDFALGYDFIRDKLTAEQRHTIETRLLREGAEFLMQHRTPQLHNHEMKINATVGVIGLILNDHQYIDFALNTEYGIKYQLEHGVRGEGLWFEGSIHYHYYALQALMAFQKLARDTPYSMASHPKFRTMLAFPLKLIMNNGDFPKLNDCIAGQEKLNHSHLFEYAYSEFGDKIFASALQQIYQNVPRDNIDALLYGVETLPHSPELSCQSIHAPEVGITLLQDQNSNNMMLLKHSPYGGEHDHYDRLGLILIKNGQEILPDLGTTGYGAELHYGYYKNSATHNTLVVNQANQTPANPELISFIQKPDFSFIDTQVDWSKQPATVDSHTLVQWDQQAYQDVTFRRSILWLGSAAIEINQVHNPHHQQLDLTWHTRGILRTDSNFVEIDNPLTGPLERMSNCMQLDATNDINTFYYNTQQPSEYYQQIYTLGGDSILIGQAPDNPATSDLSYLLLRSQQTQLRNITLHNLDGQYQLEHIHWKETVLQFTVRSLDNTRSFEIDFTKNTITAA